MAVMKAVLKVWKSVDLKAASMVDLMVEQREMTMADLKADPKADSMVEQTVDMWVDWWVALLAELMVAPMVVRSERLLVAHSAVYSDEMWVEYWAVSSVDK